MRLLESFFAQFTGQELKKITENVSVLEESIEEIYIFAVIWSLCCTTTSEGRNTLNAFVRDLIEEQLPFVQFPKTGSIYSYRYSVQEKGFVLWE